VSTIAGKYQELPYHRDGQDSSARFNTPQHIAFNWTKSELFVTDAGNAVVRKINFRPLAEFEATPTSANINVDIQFTDKSLNDATGWTWSFTPNTVTYVGGTNANSENPKVQFTVAGTYTVKLVATNGYGSGETTKLSYLSISDINSVSEGLRFEDILTVYPNPGTGEITLKPDFGYEAESVAVAIYDFSGKLILNRDSKLSNGSYLQLNGLAAGVYLLRVSDGINEVSTKLLVQ
jgi:PKD repeat protein